MVNAGRGDPSPNSRILPIPPKTKLTTMGVECRIEPLSLGDFVWAVEKIQPGHLHGAHSRKGLKLVLDHVVERKRMDDLSSSIVDKRYIEQKSRFRQAGFIRNPIYLVEDMGASGTGLASL
jgi:crossover junction endonuclease MUS81